MSEQEAHKNTLLILKSMGVNYPILNECGMGLNKLLLLIVQEGKIKTMADLLSDVDTAMLSEYMPWKKIVFILTNVNSTWVVYPYPHSRKGLDFLAMLAKIIELGEADGKKINALPLVISEGIPQGCVMDDYFTVYLDEDVNVSSVDWDLIIPSDNQIPVVIDKIVQYTANICSQDKKAFLAAACFLYPNLARKNCFQQFLDQANRLVECNENNGSTDDLGEVFIQTLYDWQKKTRFCEVYELPNLCMDAAERLEQIILFDMRFVYLKDKMFKNIVRPLLNIFSVDMLKEQIKKSGILCPEGGRTYTTKVGYYNPAGIYQRERMLRFNRERLSSFGELEFIDLCLNIRR